MIYELPRWDRAYRDLVERLSGNGRSVLILCAMDADALCAARILSYLLRADNLPYQLRPCPSRRSLRESVRSYPKDTLGAVVLLNVGGGVDLTKCCYGGDDEADALSAKDTVTYVMDCHRPWHLANVYAGENIVMFKEEPLEDDVPSDGDGLSVNDDDESDSDDDSDDSEDEDEDDEEEEEEFQDDEDVHLANTKKRRREEEKDDDEGSTSTPSDDPEPTKKQTDKAPRVSFREQRRRRRDRVDSYYHSGSYYRAPVSWIAYTLSHRLRFGDSGDLLWLACVGLSDSFRLGRLDRAGYAEFVTDLRRHVARVWPDDDDHNGVGTSLSERGRVSCRTEFRLMLLRHWSLLDAMTHSNFVATKLKVWREEGRFRLTEMLAKMGFPLEECRQPWAFMKPSLKRSLRDAVMEHKEDFGLDGINYTGFVRVTGHRSSVSAADLSHAVAALLEDDDRDPLRSFNEAYDALNAAARRRPDDDRASSSDAAGADSFADLVNGGDLSGARGVGAGVRRAVSSQRAVVETAVGLVERDAVSRLRHFRYAYVRGDADDDADAAGPRRRRRRRGTSFARPSALLRLAHFLVDMHRDVWTGRNARPLVLLAEKDDDDDDEKGRSRRKGGYLVAGYHFSEREGDVAKNRFRKYFELTAKSMEGLCEVRLESFEGNVVEVEKGGEQRFVEQLHYLMEAVQKRE